MGRITDSRYEYHEFCLGEESKQIFLKNVLNSLGFEYSGPSKFHGLSGLEHVFDAIGKRDKTYCWFRKGNKLSQSVFV